MKSDLDSPEHQSMPALAEYLPAEGENISEDQILDRFLDYVVSTGIEPYPHQEDALLEIMAGRHVVLGTPTGSGKSLVALGMQFKALCQGQRCFYTSPIKALASEKFFDLCERLGPERVGMLTGDASINRDASIICCTAEILSNLAIRDPAEDLPTAVVMDEFHYYSDRERGVAWQVPLLCMPKTQFLLMSATLGETEPIEAHLHRLTELDCSVVDSAERPVPLDWSYRETPLQESLIALRDAGQLPVYIVNFTQRECAELAQSLSSVSVCSKEERREIQAAMRGANFDSPFGKTLRRLLGGGIAIHHAGLLPKYRLLVEQLAQAGHLKVICGTDTLGVGVNIPIRTVLFNKLAKFDGQKMGILSARDFHQIAGRAGRKGFDDAGSVVCQAPEHVIHNLRAAAKASAGKKVQRKKAQQGAVIWSQKTFDQLQVRKPEALVSRFHVSHGMIINALERETPPYGYHFLVELVQKSHDADRKKQHHLKHAARLTRALRRAGLVTHVKDEEQGNWLEVAEDLQEDFSLHETLSLFLVDAVAALDPEAEDYALSVLSRVEAILENPRAVLNQQHYKRKGELLARLKAEGMSYDERSEALEEAEFEVPEEEIIRAMFAAFTAAHPWVQSDAIQPKSIAREMFEHCAGFAQFIKQYQLQRSEGLLLRYLSQVYKTLVQTVPESARDLQLLEIMAYLRAMLERVDASLVEEWEQMQGLGTEGEAEVAEPDDLVTSLSKDPAKLTARIRAEILNFVSAIAAEDYEAATRAIRPSSKTPDGRPWDARTIQSALQGFYEEYEQIIFTPASRKREHTRIEPDGPGAWSIGQTLVDPDDDLFWYFRARVDLRRFAEEGGAGPLLILEEIGS